MLSCYGRFLKNKETKWKMKHPSDLAMLGIECTSQIKSHDKKRYNSGSYVCVFGFVCVRACVVRACVRTHIRIHACELR